MHTHAHARTQATATVVGLSVIRLVTAGPMKEAGEPASPKDTLFNYSLAVRARTGYVLVCMWVRAWVCMSGRVSVRLPCQPAPLPCY